MNSSTLLAVLVSTTMACGGPAKPGPEPATAPATADAPAPRPTLPATMAPAFGPIEWMLGDWRASGGARMHWVAAAGTLYGVGFSAGGWDVSIIDDGDGVASRADGVRRLIDLGTGYYALERTEAVVSGQHVQFGTGDLAVDYRLGTGQLSVEYSMLGFGDSVHPDQFPTELVGRDPRTGGQRQTWYAAADEPSAPELEAADRAFDADTAAEGVAGWVKWFAPDGALWRDERFEGRDAIGAKLRPTLESGTLRWKPIASRMLDDRHGFTVGTATWTANGKTAPEWAGSYVTIWGKQADGTWKVVFDTGRTDQPTN